jgi:hypothetical protein
MGAELAKVIAVDQNILHEERIWSVIPPFPTLNNELDLSQQHFLKVVSFNVPTAGSPDWKDGWAYRRGSLFFYSFTFSLIERK